MNYSLNLSGKTMFGLQNQGMLKSTKDRLDRQAQRDGKIEFYEKQKQNLKNTEAQTVEEIAKIMEMPKEQVVLALEAIVEPVSLYEPVFSDGNDTIYVMDQIGDKNDDSTWIEEIAVKEAIANLSDREKRILSMRFFRGKTQMEVAAEIGISQAQVSRIEKGALDTIKKNI